MAREIDSRLRLTGMLVAQSPIHVGGFGDDVDTDFPLARNGLGELYLPGTSLAGAIRHWCDETFGDVIVKQFWGDPDDIKGQASFVLVEDAIVQDADRVIPEIRDHVGIDREYGAAAEQIKYDRAILPRGTKMRFVLTLEVHNQSLRRQAVAVVSALKEALEEKEALKETGEIQFGAAKTRGLGHVRLADGQFTEQVFSTRQGILQTLRSANGKPVDVAEIVAAKSERPAASSRSRLHLRIHWQPLGPLMAKAGSEGIACDMLPLTSGNHGQISLVLPGSSIKGALRNHAERIVRTLRGGEPQNWMSKEGNRNRFLDSVKVDLVNELFGAAGKKVDKGNDDRWLPGHGALGVKDCYGKQQIATDKWNAIQRASNDQVLRTSLNDAGLDTWSQTYHVAVDRWLGSAAESMLFSALEPHRTAWEPFELTINLPRLPDEKKQPAIALLLLVIRDLANQRIPLGFSTNRGTGSVSISNVEFMTRNPGDELASLANVQLSEGKLLNVPDTIKQSWTEWINAEVSQ